MKTFPESYQKQRSLLKPVLSLAQSKGFKARLIANKILVEGKSYNVDQIKDLPPYLNPEKECVVQDLKTVCFFVGVLFVKLLQESLRTQWSTL